MSNPPNREGWPPTHNPGSGPGIQNNDQMQGQGPRSMGGYGGPSVQQQPPQPPPGPGSGHVLPPPSGSYYTTNQGVGHNLPAIGGLAQGQHSSPGQGEQRVAPPSQEISHGAPPPPPAQPSMQSGPYTLPNISQSLASQHHSSHQGIDRDQEMRDRDDETRDRHADDLRARPDQRGRDIPGRHQSEHSPRENHTGQIQIHQPVAVAPQIRSVHGPNGILSDNTLNPPNQSLAHPSSGPSIGGSNPNYSYRPHEPGQRITVSARRQSPAPVSQQTSQPQPTQPQSSMIVPFGGAGGQAAPGPQQQAVNIGQGQQPILNDALSYLDQVKVQFADQPDVYNRFLDIMKDFKSGAIDTPGVIERVSNLFSGNPNLIQGFNTFLPPGYRIECGTIDDPNAIRVTTPMGTMLQTLPAMNRPHSNPRPAANGSAAPDRQLHETQVRAPTGPWQQQQPANEGMEAIFGPNRAPAQSVYGVQQRINNSAVSPESLREAAPSAASIAHQQEHQGVSQLQNAVSAASNASATNRQNVLSPSTAAAVPASAQGLNGVASATGEKRGPVEFNHAISYVNKIKNRFASQPDIYKQFLEILQTYQRESKPIGDVYAQVTSLFAGAPDLLEDFKQFLPESAAPHRAAQAQNARLAEENVQTSNVRGDGPLSTPTQNHQSAHTPRADQQPGRLPPLGNFATPTSNANRDNKRKRSDRQGPIATSSAVPAPIPEPVGAPARGNFASGNNMSKQRNKQHYGAKQPLGSEGPVISPTLTPAIPIAMPPSTSTSATQDEMAFFDRAKKFIGNKNSMNEFLKLCNLYTQDLITKELLVHRAHAFIGGNPDLFAWFKKFMGYEEKEESEEVISRVERGRVSLAHCRGLGPSYRLLPKAERMRKCSGRDDLCRAVLNDEWASHPTWASEDSGFVAHRKNTYEEGLHRLEEERHDYDFNIEACIRVLQQLDPICHQLLQIDKSERANFAIPPGLGGPSETIYKRVIMRIYGREKGAVVTANLFSQPWVVIPFLLPRLKQMLEKWRAAQREWEKVWRDQQQKLFWKSLDHQSASVKQTDKRSFQMKTLQNEIQVKYEEQKRQREIHGISTPAYQFVYSFEDEDVLVDVSRLIMSYADAHQGEYNRITSFLVDFVPLFFGLDPTEFVERLKTSAEASPTNEEDDEETPSPSDGFVSRLKKPGSRNQGLLRGVLDRGRSNRSSRKEKENSVASGSRASTPGDGSAVEDDIAAADSASESIKENRQTWISHPIEGNEREIKPTEPYKRTIFHMYSNIGIYCFFRMFVILYERLLALKQNEGEVQEQVRRALEPKPALDLKIVDKTPDDFFADVRPSANYYRQMLEMFDEMCRGDGDGSVVEETLRRYYLQTGWQLYHFDKLMSALTRFTSSVVNSELKERNYEIYSLFKKDRPKEETTHQDELNYRKAAEKFNKDGDLYRISFDLSEMKAYAQIFKKHDPTFNFTQLTADKRWRYYIASWIGLDHTEGVDQSSVSIPLRKHGLPELDDDSEETSDILQSITSDEHLNIRICVNTYKMVFAPKSEEWYLRSENLRVGGEDSSVEAEHEREQEADVAQQRLAMNTAWMKDLSKDDVDAKKLAFSNAATNVDVAALSRDREDEDDIIMDA